MVRYFFILSALIFTMGVKAQMNTNSKIQKSMYEKEMREKEASLISDFIAQLDADDFQKEIIEQKLHTYATKKKQIYKETQKEYVLHEKS